MQSRKKMLAAGATAAVMALGFSASGAVAQEDESLNVNALNNVADVGEVLSADNAANGNEALNGNSALNGNNTEAATAGDVNAANGNSADGNSADVGADGNNVDASDGLDVTDTLDSIVGLE